MDITSLVIYLLDIILIACLVIDNIRIRIRHNRTLNDAMQLAIDKLSLIQKLQEINSKQDSTNVEKTEGFLKFVSESRDWAFQYIEEVQEAILEYVTALDDGNPDRVAESLEKLIGMLPEKR